MNHGSYLDDITMMGKAYSPKKTKEPTEVHRRSCPREKENVAPAGLHTCVTQWQGLLCSPLPYKLLLKAVPSTGPLHCSHTASTNLPWELWSMTTKEEHNLKGGRGITVLKSGTESWPRRRAQKPTGLTVQRLVTPTGTSYQQWIVSPITYCLLEMHFQPLELGTAKDSMSLF